MTQRRTRRAFTPEFKAEAVKLAQDGAANVAAVARNLDLDVSALRDWIRRARLPAPDAAALSASERQELAQLRRDNAVLRMEREVLKNLPEGPSDLLNQKLPACYRRFGPDGATVGFLVTLEPVKKHGPGTAADLALVTPSSDPV